MTLEQHLEAGRLLMEIRNNLRRLRELLPGRQLKNRCISAQRHIQTRLIDHLRFSHWEAEKNPDGSYTHNLNEDPYSEEPPVGDLHRWST